MEQWLVLNEEGYEISNLGRVKNPREVILKGSITYNREGKPYRRVKILGHKYLVHRLVLQAFKPIENPENMYCDHIDGNGLNNNLSNLRWATNRQNQYNATWTTTNVYKGVHYDTRLNRWRSDVKIDGIQKGKSFQYFIDAFLWRIKMVKEHYDQLFYKV
jgi:hypothetical protein